MKLSYMIIDDTWVVLKSFSEHWHMAFGNKDSLEGLRNIERQHAMHNQCLVLASIWLLS